MSAFKEKIKRKIKKMLGISEPHVDTVEDYRACGVTVGEGTCIYGANIDKGHGFLITIGKNCIISSATILAHDGSTHIALGYTRVGSVHIGDEVFVGIGAIVLPGVTIGDRCIIGAGAVVTKDVPAGSVVAGNPARVLCSYEDYIAKHRAMLETSPRYETYHADKTQEEKERMKTELADRMGYDK